MKKNKYPRLMIAGVKSGSGKTTLTCALLKSLKNRNLNLTSFKCGPDYIDPMFHSEVIGINSRNLDLFFNEEETIKSLFCKNAENSDIALIEGVMGFYDGISAESTAASSYDLARVLETPVVLVLDCEGMYLSIVPAIKGYIDYKKDSNIKGVILNNVSQMIYGEMKEVIEIELNIKVLGHLPNMKEISFESRHLGLITAKEVEELESKLEVMAEKVSETVDLDSLIALANEAPDIEHKSIHIKKIYDNINIAVAMDKAFCFYYADNLDLLREMGANIIPFSPINDEKLPENIDGLIIGGGYPEVYAKKLSHNKSMRNDIYEAITLKGLPTIAECGGFMYLNETLEDIEGTEFKMVGAIKGKSYKTNKLGRFGYISLTAQEDTLICKKGMSIKGHEFHYWDSTCNGQSFKAQKPMRKKNWLCINSINNLFAGYPHLHYYSNIDFASNFIHKCNDYKKGR